MKNTEIKHIKKIMGLKQGTVYKSVDGLRYGSLMIMTDQVRRSLPRSLPCFSPNPRPLFPTRAQDHDGSHIKGLLINFLDHFFPALLKIPGFLVEFITPIVKVYSCSSC